MRYLSEAARKITDGKVQSHIGAHIRAVTGGKFNNLGVYHASDQVSAEDKLLTYKLLFNALTAKGGPDYAKLSGQVGNGAAKVTADEAPQPVTGKEILEAGKASGQIIVAHIGGDAKGGSPSHHEQAAAPQEEPNAATVPQAKPEVKASVKTAPAASKPASGQAGSLEDAILRLVEERAHVSGGSIDPEAVKKIAAETFAEEYAKGADDRAKVLAAAMKNAGLTADEVKAIALNSVKGCVTRIEFATKSGEFKPLDGLMHPQVPQLTAWLRAGVPTWAHSKAGSGKTHSARQIAELLEVEPYVISVDPTLTVSKLLGYRNVANGDFVEGFIYKAYKNGGLAALDEIDTGDPGVIASINALLSNSHYLFPNNETVKRHDKFYCLALANSKGFGATAGYVARNRLDAATLDRFAIIEYRYDEGLEMALACGVGSPGKPWQPKRVDASGIEDTCEAYVKWVQQVREFVKDSVLISPRASINGCKALRVGVSVKEVVDSLVFKLCAEDTIKRIGSACGNPTGYES